MTDSGLYTKEGSEVEVTYDGKVLTCIARYYGKIAKDQIEATIERALSEEVGRLLIGKPEFKKAIHRMALEKLGQALLKGL
jgi:hypothetical protein